MTTKIRLWVAGFMLATVLGFVCFADTTRAGGGKDLKGAVAKVAELIKKGDKAGAQKAAAAAAKSVEEVGDVMHLFRPRNKGGLGFGPTAGSNPAKDGIEVALRDFARDVPASVTKQTENIEATGYWIAALADVSHGMAPKKDTGKKTKKNWEGWSNEMREAGLEFAKAKSAQALKTASAKVNASCNNCHSVFKE